MFRIVILVVKKIFVNISFLILIVSSIAFIGNNGSETAIVLLNKLAMLLGHIGPLFFANDLQIEDVSWIHAVNLHFQGFLQMFDGIQVRRLTWPLQNLYIILYKPPDCQFCCMFWGVVLLECSVISEVQLLDGAVQVFLQNIAILCSIHNCVDHIKCSSAT